jgi:NAD(P)H dehydrogenase (quinone)
MSTQKFLVIGATGKTGQHTVQHLLDRGHAVRAIVHKEDERSAALRRTGAEVVIGELLEHDDVIRAAVGTGAAYFCYPVSPGLIQATALFRGRGQAGGAQSRCKHVADFCAGRFRKPRRA